MRVPSSPNFAAGPSGGGCSLTMPAKLKFDSVESVLAYIREGRMVIVTDDEDRENEGDLLCAAEKITPDISPRTRGR